jgi:integrase
MVMKWGTKSIQKLQKNPPEKPKRIFEGDDLKGFHVQMTPAGTVTPALQYPVAGKKTFLKCGPKLKAGLPDKTVGAWLKTARRAAEDARDAVDEGRNPKAEKAAQVAQEEASNGGTVNELLDVYLWTVEGKFSHAKTKQDLARDVRPVIGDMVANTVKGRDIAIVTAGVLKRAKAKGFTGQSSRKKLRGTLRKSFQIGRTFDNDDEMISEFPHLRFNFEDGAPNPVDSTPIIKPTEARDRVLIPKEIKQAWDAGPSFQDKRVGYAIRLALLTGYRRGTVAGLRWDEVGDDIFIQASAFGRNKSARDHYLPMTPMLQETLDEMRQLFNDGVYVFPAVHSGKNPHMMPELISTSIPDFCKHAGLEHFTFHDLRRTCVTEMADAEIDSDIRRRIVNHKVGDDVHDEVYDRRSWLKLRPKVLEGLTKWHEVLGRIVKPKAPTPLRRVS